MAFVGQLHPKYIFGLNGSVKGRNFSYVENNTILYPAGNSIVVLNVDQKSQQFLHGVEKGRAVTSIAVSFNRLYSAIGQTGSDGSPYISIYELKSNQRKKMLVNNELLEDLKEKEYISLTFTVDNIHILSLTSPPDSLLILWRWDKNKVMSVSKVTGTGPFYEIGTSTTDSNIFSIIGQGTCRFYRHFEGNMKQYGYSKGENINFKCHGWHKGGERTFVGTSEGKVIWFEKGELKHEISVKLNSEESNGAGGTSKQQQGGKDDENEDTSDRKKNKPVKKPTKEITSIIVFGRGFAFSMGTGIVCVYDEQSSYEEPYKHIYTIRIPQETSESQDRIINTIDISPNEEFLGCTTQNNNIYHFQLSSAEIKEPEEMIFELANCSYHNGSIVSMDVAIRKSLVVTCGTDKFIRIWNFLTMSQEASREFAEDIYSVALHPTGLFVLAGCIDKIRYLTHVIDDIRDVKDWPVRSCKAVKFSNGGHLFAAAYGNILQLYSTTTLENVSALKGHSNKIKRITWSIDDTKIITAGADGAIYEWDVKSSKRSADVVERGSLLISIVSLPDGKTQYAINSSKFLKEVQLSEGMISKEVELEMAPTSLCISRSGKNLFVGFEDGTVRSLKQPLTYSGEWSDYRLHCGSVNEIHCTFDEIYLVSCSFDNCLVMWKITDAEGRVAKLEKDLDYSTEILVTRNDMEERQMAFNDLKQRFTELKLEMDYALKRKDMSYMEQIKDLNDKYEYDMTSLTNRVDDLLKEKDKNTESYNSYLQDVSKAHCKSMSNLEAHYNTKLITEYEKYNELQTLLEDTVQKYDLKMIKLEEERNKGMEEMMNYFEEKMRDKNTALETAYNDSRTQMEEKNEMIKQIEEDADQEILELVTNYERKLKTERESNMKLKSDLKLNAGIMKKKFQTMQKDIEEQKSEVQRLVMECSKLATVVQLTEKEVIRLQKELVDRDISVANKDQIVGDLKKTNTELEKFKFVLDYRIKELRKVIEPKEREILYLKQQNLDMESELDSIGLVKNGLQLNTEELKNKLQMMDQEYLKERWRRMMAVTLVSRIRSHMAKAMSLLTDHKALKRAVKTMYNKFGEDSTFGQRTSAEQDAICELVRQKNHLELSLHSIKKKLAKDTQFTRTEQLKTMHENMLLVYEINSLRRELKLARDKIANFEHALGVTQATNATEAAEMRLKLQNAIEERDHIEFRHEDSVELKDKTIQAQQNEIDNLATKIMKVHEYVIDTVRPEVEYNSAVEHIQSVLGTNVH